MKKVFAASVMVLFFVALAVPGFAGKNDTTEKKSNGKPVKVLVCHFTQSFHTHKSDYDFLVIGPDGSEIDGARECCNLVEEETGIKTVLVPSSSRGWEREGHEGGECVSDELIEMYPALRLCGGDNGDGGSED